MIPFKRTIIFPLNRKTIMIMFTGIIINLRKKDQNDSDLDYD